jgi:hypothetical protein
MSQIDTRFLSVHPRTALWFEQRKQCAKCKHERHFKTTEGERGDSKPMICLKAQGENARRVFCIDAREDDGACGPDAKLFQPKE